MKNLHEELRRGREEAGLTQQALADLVGIPRNQIVRAERGENITIDTLRKIVPHLPVTSLTLLETKTLRVDTITDPERLFRTALENVLHVAGALDGAVRLAMHAHAAMETSRLTEPAPRPEDDPTAGTDIGTVLRRLEEIAAEIQSLANDVTIAS